MPGLERLHKVLANAGFGSRRTCEQLIAAGEVLVDGHVVTEMGVKVDATKQKIKCGDRYVRPRVMVAYALNKPKNVVCTTADERGRRTVVDLLRGVRERVYPAGRLDADSRGLIILTNDGDLCVRLTHPRFRVPKTYHVVLEGMLTPEVIAKVQKGVWLAEGKTSPVKVRIHKRQRDMTILEVTIYEGMNREIRRIFAKYGYEVTRLKRVRIGGLDLGSLPEGHFRRLEHYELEKLFQFSPEAVRDRKARDEEA